MSYEFGVYTSGGYMYEKVSNAADDCDGGEAMFTKQLGGVLHALTPLALRACAIEAGDTSESHELTAGSQRNISQALLVEKRLKEFTDYLWRNK